ncbi:MAG: cation:dicarboxylase symporter family transporter [Clostridiales bacterium]|nr:cation:dicarboxylase symporter family transporter [Candidatus Equinaster intestinalis]
MDFYKLNNETIDLLSDKLGEMYMNAGSSKKELMRAKLLLEEALLKYQSHFGDDVEISFRSYRIFGQFRFSVRLRAPSFDPFTLEENPMAFMIQNIMSTFENGMPTWKYHNLENELVFTFRKKAVIGSLAKIAIAIGAAIVLGVFARLTFSAEALTAFTADYITPISDAYAGLFCVMAILLTFFAIALSIVHIGDLASFGAIGGKIMARFIGISSIAVIALTLPVLPLFNFSGVGEFTVAAKSIYDILVGFIPTNLVAPFLNFNSVHIMLVGAMFGFSLLTLNQKGENLVKVFEECNLVAVITNDFFNKFICFYVGFKIFAIITTSNFAELKSAGKMVGAILIAEFLLMVCYTVYALIKTKMPFGKFVKTVTPAFAVCISSANFGAAFNCVFDAIFACGVDTDTGSLAVNLGSVFFQPACTVVFVFSSLFMASSYGVEISLIWVVTAIILSIILVGSMPNVPGASVAVITLLYAQLGLPNEALTLMITINALLQFVTVGVDAWCLQSEILCLNAGMKKKALKK